MAGLLWREVGVASLVGIALIFFVFFPLQLILSSQYKRLRHETAEITDKRVKTMGEIIVGIRTLKAYAWENAFEDMVKNLRQRELVHICLNRPPSPSPSPLSLPLTHLSKQMICNI